MDQRDDKQAPAEQAEQAEQVNPQLSIITVMIDHSEGMPAPIYDLGGVDPWAAYTILNLVASEIWDLLPFPRATDGDLL